DRARCSGWYKVARQARRPRRKTLRTTSPNSSMPRFRTAAAATLLVVPMVAGGFLLQEPPARANGLLFDQEMSLVRNQYVDSMPTSAAYEKAAKGLVHELNDPYSELLSPKE